MAALDVAKSNLAAAQAVQAAMNSHVEQLQSTVTELETAANTPPTLADLKALVDKLPG